MINDELEHIKNLNLLELVQYFQDGIIARATGGSFDDELYKVARTQIIQNKILTELLPNWIKIKRDIDQFWTFIKGKFPSYQERREFLWKEFEPALNYLETQSTSPIETTIIFDEAHIHSQWEKALERKIAEPEGAITAARTLVESILKHILDEQKIKYNDGADLPDLYKQVAKSLNLAPEQHQEQIFKQIL